MLLGIKKFAIFGFVATLLLTTPLSRVPQKRVRILISLLMAVIVFFIGVWPYVAPLVDRKQLSQLQTKLDPNGICLQSTDFTCGPAAAVTALRKLGLPAEEGEIAILSCTSFQEGTPIDMLADGLNRRYATSGLSVECRAFHEVAELKQAGLTLAVIKYGFMVDHWVTVLETTDSEVVVGDPLGGIGRISYEDFAKKWRFIGLVLKR
jgi:predicted double-glycine peptidase